MAEATVAVTLCQALAVRDEATLSSCLEGECRPLRGAEAPRAARRSLEPATVGSQPSTHLQRPPAQQSIPPSLRTPRGPAVQEPAVVASSVARLSTPQAVALLEALVERLQREPQQAARLASWLRSLLLAKGTALAATPTGQVTRRAAPVRAQTSSACHAGSTATRALQLPLTAGIGCPPAQATLQLADRLLQERTAAFGQLLGLSGRLQVLQPGGTSAGSSATPAAAAAAKVRSHDRHTVWWVRGFPVSAR